MVERTATNLISGPSGASLPCTLRNNHWITADTVADTGPKRKSAIRIGISAKSIRKYGISGNGISAFASVRRAARAAKTPAPAKVTVVFCEDDSAKLSRVGDSAYLL